MEQIILTILFLNSLATIALGCALFFVIRSLRKLEQYHFELDARTDSQFLEWAREHDSLDDYLPFGEVVRELNIDPGTMSKTVAGTQTMTQHITPPRYDKEYFDAMRIMDEEDTIDYFSPEEVRNFCDFLSTLSFGERRRKERFDQRKRWYEYRKGLGQLALF